MNLDDFIRTIAAVFVLLALAMSGLMLWQILAMVC